MLPKGIFFDLDDTIIAYTPVADPTWRRICIEYAETSGLFGADTLFNKIRETSMWYWSDEGRHKAGRSDLNSARRKILEMAFDKLDIEDQATAWEIADAFSVQREEAICLFDGAEETLEYLNSRHVSLALLTNGEAIKQRNKVERYGLERFFKSILIEGELGFGKPEEAIYYRALNELGLSPTETWAVGDNLEWDVFGPQRLGVFGIWNNFARKGIPEGLEMRPDRIIHGISELME